MWQALYEELADRNFMVIAVAMDSREGDPLPWIEAARPTYVTLIDRPTLKYLIDVLEHDARLAVCPDYVEHWMYRESTRDTYEW